MDARRRDQCIAALRRSDGGTAQRSAVCVFAAWYGQKGAGVCATPLPIIGISTSSTVIVAGWRLGVVVAGEVVQRRCVPERLARLACACLAGVGSSWLAVGDSSCWLTANFGTAWPRAGRGERLRARGRSPRSARDLARHASRAGIRRWEVQGQQGGSEPPSEHSQDAPQFDIQFCAWGVK